MLHLQRNGTGGNIRSLNVQIATNVVAKLMALEAIDDKKDIKLYINSAGKSL